HILPNAGPLLLSYLATIFAWALVNITALEFLGVVGSPADALWGRLLRDGRLYLVEAPWVALAPTLALILVVSVAAFLSESKNARP
ncbi:MAG: ABC transporter permease subunit, partial [Anaerolineae bacterium]